MGSLQLSNVSCIHIIWLIELFVSIVILIRIDEVEHLNNAAGGNAKNTWAFGIPELYDEENFNACMIPFNDLRIDYQNWLFVPV